MSDSVRPHRQQPTRLGRPWDSPGENTGVGDYSVTRTQKLIKLLRPNYLINGTVSSFFWPSVVVQSLSYVWLFATPWTATCQASLSLTVSWNLLKLVSIESVMPSNHPILCHLLLLLLSIFSSIRVFSSESALRIRWPKHWSFGLSISPSNEYSGLISFRTDWIDFFAVQVTLKSLLQYHNCIYLFYILTVWKDKMQNK